MKETTDKILDLTLEDRAALERRLLARRRAVAAPRPAGWRPLTPAQEGIWLHQQLADGTALYNIPQVFRLTGKLDVAALQQSAEHVARQHEALRTRIRLVDGQPMQMAADNAEFRLGFADLPADDWRRAADVEAAKPFALEDQPLIRGSLWRLGPGEYLLGVSFHHLIADNWSLGIFWEQISRAYAQLSKGHPIQPETVTAYSELCANEGVASDATIAFWKERLSGDLPEMALPSDHARPSRPSFRGRWHPFLIQPPLTARLKELARREHATLYMTLLAAYAALLHRYSGEDVMLIGTPLAQRDAPGAENAIGMLINTVAARMDLSGDPPFTEFLSRVKAEILACHCHGRTPFEKVLEALHRPRHGGGQAIFQTVFQSVRLASDSLQLPGVRVEEVAVRTGTSKFDLTVTLGERDGGLRGQMEYALDLFQSETINRMTAHYETLLESIALRPNAPISELDILPARERHQVVVGWNQTATEYPRERTIDDLFAEQAERASEKVALVFQGEGMTYGELNRRANQVAAYLDRLGVRPGGHVGICLERSFDLIIGLLGTLKAGCAYVPLDPSFPAARLEYMLRDSKATPVLNNAAMAEARNEPDRPPRSRHGAGDPAYIIYTSGSTGEPKGVVVPHRGVVRLVKNTNYALFGPDEVFLQFAPVTFDASTLEIWGPLLNGGRLVIFPPRFESIEQLGEVLRDNRVTTLWLTAGLFHQMADLAPSALCGVRQLLAGGDVLSAPHVKKMLRRGVRVINGYGPTENTTFTCCYPLPAGWDGASPPIGRPISNTQVYILDKKLKPVPIGVAGELCAGGDGLALAYLNAPELTGSRFVPDPFGPPGGRLYRTGDRARFRPDGVIEFLGRADNQVKIRGFRVELAEVEQALASHPDISETVVTARADASCTRHLTAYCVARPGCVFSAGELRAFLGKRLPAYAVPSDFVFLDKLPLTANGKVDRRRLPAPERRGESIRAEPQDETERRLAEIWRQVLGLAQVGMDENFFELGGHSLLAMRVMARVGQTFGTSLPLSDLFEHPTITALAEVVRQGGNNISSEIIPRRARHAALV